MESWFLVPVLLGGGAARWVLAVKNPPTNARDTRDTGSVLGLGRSPEGGHGNPLQYSCLEDPMNRRAWQAIVHGVTKSWTWLKWLSRHAHTSEREVPFKRQGTYYLPRGLSVLSLWLLTMPLDIFPDCCSPGTCPCQMGLHLLSTPSSSAKQGRSCNQ